jgi:DNA-directed RNA polymerase subunit alpha
MGGASAVDTMGVVESEAPEYGAVHAARDAAWRDAEARRKLTHLLASLPAEPSAAKEDRAAALRRGLALYVLGREVESLPWLAASTSRGVRLLRARALLGLGRAAEALQVLGETPKDADAASIAAEAHAALGDGAAARAAAETVKDRVEAAYLRALAAEADADRRQAAEAYDEALDADPDHSRALFRRARLEAMHGNDEEAIEMYRRCLDLPNPPVNAYLNLGNLYEDRGEFTKARECYRAVLAAEPANPRAAGRRSSTATRRRRRACSTTRTSSAAPTSARRCSASR